MPVYGLYIQKEIPYFGEMRPAGNTYHYDISVEPEGGWGLLGEYVAGVEQDIMADDVHFSGWTVWGPTDGPQVDNVIIDSGQLDMNGTAGSGQQMYSEACSLAYWTLPRAPVTNKRRWLRKFWRLGLGDSAELSPDVVGGKSQIPQAVQDMLAQAASQVALPPMVGATRSLCTEDGTVATSDGNVRPYFFTRQIGQ